MASVRRRFTVSERRWPETVEFVAFLEQATTDVSATLLSLVWQGYDLLRQDLAEVDFSQAYDDLERNLTELLERRIRRVMSGFEPFEVQHGPYERASRKPAPAQPPQYDIAFSLRANERIFWPLEAKVLATDGAVGEYVRDIREQYLTGRYAPFSREAGMVGYLLQGQPTLVFTRVSEVLCCVLHEHPAFLDRDHRVSEHKRMLSEGSEPTAFRCHHVIMRLTTPDR